MAKLSPPATTKGTPPTSLPCSSSTTRILHFLDVAVVLPLKWMYDFIKDLSGLPYRFIVHTTANLLADIMEHPRVMEAAAVTMVNGLNKHLDDPNFPKRAARIYIQLQEDADLSKQLGEQFPKQVQSFIAGAARGLKRQASFSKLRQSLKRENSSNRSLLSRQDSSSPAPTASCDDDDDVDDDESDHDSSFRIFNALDTTERTRNTINPAPSILKSTRQSKPSSPLVLYDDDKMIIQTPDSIQSPTPSKENSKEDILIKLAFPWMSPGGGDSKRSIQVSNNTQRQDEEQTVDECIVVGMELDPEKVNLPKQEISEEKKTLNDFERFLNVFKTWQQQQQQQRQQRKQQHEGQMTSSEEPKLGEVNDTNNTDFENTLKMSFPWQQQQQPTWKERKNTA